MDLYRKVRTLVGALIHQPFASRPKPVPAEEAPSAQVPGPGAETGLDGEARRREGAKQDSREPETLDGERVADLIAQQKQDRGRRSGTD